MNTEIVAAIKLLARHATTTNYCVYLYTVSASRSWLPIYSLTAEIRTVTVKFQTRLEDSSVLNDLTVYYQAFSNWIVCVNCVERMVANTGYVDANVMLYI